MTRLSRWTKSEASSRSGFREHRTRLQPSLERMEVKALLSTLHVGTGQQFASIQAAVDQADRGDTIAVEPGTYTEQVTIPASLDNLTLRSTNRGQAVIQAPSTLAGRKAIVENAGASGLSIRGFTISGPSTGILAGILIDDGGSATISQNHITRIQDDPFSGVQSGLGIYVQDATATITSNTVDNYQKAGIVVDATDGPAFATISNNTVTGVGLTSVNGQNGIQISNGASAWVSRNDVSANLFDSPDQSVGASGIYLFNAGAVTVDRNKVSDNDLGILVQNSTFAVISNNQVSDSTFVGINLVNSRLTLVANNTVSGSAFDGILVDPTSRLNFLLGNRLRNNGNLDAEDLSSGFGTAGTANFWFGNQGKTDNKGGRLV
jgi:parallel beta-helix repeat protein